MNCLLLGANGQLGRHVRHRLGEVSTCARSDADFNCDLSDLDALDSVLNAVRPQTIINAAAWTAVDDAEEHREAAFRLNRDLPGHLAAWCRRHDSLLVHYSTDYVFSGHPGRAWREDDPVAPESVYGMSKLGGEQAVAASGCRALALRTAWVYSALPGNFISAILNRAGQGKDLRVVSDQSGSPTWAGTLAAATHTLLQTVAGEVKQPTVLHVAGQGAMTWHELASLAVQMAAERGIINASVAVEPITSDQWPQKAKRPVWSVLDGSRYEHMTGQVLPDAEVALADCLDQWKDAPC